MEKGIKRMGKQGHGAKGRDRTTLVLVWLLAILMGCLVVTAGLFAREGLHAGFAAVEVPEPDPELNEHLVQVTPVPETQTMDAASPTPAVTATPLPTPTATPEPTPEPTPAPTVHPLNGDVLEPGMAAPIAIDIQIRLMMLEYLDFEQPEEVYEPGVANAVALFQRRNGLQETGLCDGETFLKLNDEKAVAYAVLPGDTGDEVESIQERLMELGYLQGPADGVFGNDTAEAVKRFRTLNQLGSGTSVDARIMEVLFGDEPVSNTLKQGDKSDEVLSLQQRLLALGYLVTKPNGTYGKMTAQAVKRFQTNNGLVVDGNLGQGTIALLLSEQAQGHVFSTGDRGSDVEVLQQLLGRLNYMKLNQATGYYGDMTEGAVSAFQSRNGLKADGKVGPKTLDKLLFDPVAAPTASPTPKATAKATPKATTKCAKKATATPKAGDEPAPTAESQGDTGSGSTIDYGEGVEAMIAAAESRLGCKYVRGAKGPDKFDCSGFVYWCINQAGVKQSYMTSIRWRTCSTYQRITSMDELRRGDILVFVGDSSSTGHVGIYLGNNKMIDAGSSPGCVVIRSSIRTSYWTKHFLMAYRIWD